MAFYLGIWASENVTESSVTLGKETIEDEIPNEQSTDG